MTGWGSKRWDLCQIRGCVRLTKSGEKERDLDKRWCSFHEPVLRRKRLDALAKGLRRTAKCVVARGPKASEGAKKGFIVVRQGPVCSVALNLKTQASARCFDPDLRWKKKRCATVPRKSRAVGQVPIGREVKTCVVCGAEMADTSVALCEDCS